MSRAGWSFFWPGAGRTIGSALPKPVQLTWLQKEMKMSYKKAWELVNEALNAQTSSPVVIPQVGGKKVVGQLLAAEGMELIKYHYRLLRQKILTFLEKETQTRLKV